MLAINKPHELHHFLTGAGCCTEFKQTSLIMRGIMWGIMWGVMWVHHP